MNLLTVKEAAGRLRVSAATVYALVARKLLRHERIGTGRGAIRIPEDAVEEYRKRRTVEAGTNGGGPKPAPARHRTVAFKHRR
jgi:excisionase family DNA binding protein